MITLTLKDKQLGRTFVLDLDKRNDVDKVIVRSESKNACKLTIKGSGELRKINLEGEILELEISEPLLKLEVFEATGLSNKSFPVVLCKCPALKVIDWVESKFDRVPKSIMKITTLEQFCVDFTKVTFPIGMTKLYPLKEMVGDKSTLMFKSKIKLSDLDAGHMVKGMGATLPGPDQSYGDNGETLIVDN